MLLRVIFILTVCFLTSSTSNAATICSDNIANIASEKLKKNVVEKTNLPSDKKDIAQGLIISDGELSLSPTLQMELASEITQARKCLIKLEDFLAKETEAKIGLVYIHQGYDHWSLQFTYGGYLLDTEERIIINTTKIFELKKIFANTKSLQITSSNYQTTRYMNQLGPILHESQS